MFIDWYGVIFLLMKLSNSPFFLIAGGEIFYAFFSFNLFCLIFVWGLHMGLPFCFDVYAAWTWQIKVSNSALISAFMTELEADTPVVQVCITIFFMGNSIWVLKLFEDLFYPRCCFSVIMIVCNCQPVLFWRGIWNFLLNAWTICQWNSRRFVLSLPEGSQVMIPRLHILICFLSSSSNTIIETCHVSKPNSKHGFKREGNIVNLKWILLSPLFDRFVIISFGFPPWGFCTLIGVQLCNFYFLFFIFFQYCYLLLETLHAYRR